MYLVLSPFVDTQLTLSIDRVLLDGIDRQVPPVSLSLLDMSLSFVVESYMCVLDNVLYLLSDRSLSLVKVSLLSPFNMTFSPGQHIVCTILSEEKINRHSRLRGNSTKLIGSMSCSNSKMLGLHSRLWKLRGMLRDPGA